MKKQKRLISAALSLSMVLSLFGGSLVSAVAAQTATTVVTDSELAYQPLTPAANITYEQHEEGYGISLERGEDSVTMALTAVPGDEGSRAMEKARLYVRTGVVLNTGRKYRVSFSLSAEQAQPEYAACFDSAAVEWAFGSVIRGPIEAGATDRVEYEITPEGEQGELVLRLLLGKTGAAGNVLRFSGLAVEEVSENEAGKNILLVDHLDYNTPGFIRLGVNSDSGAVITSDGSSATLTVTQEPTAGAEVWKIKLLVATGLKPEAGKMYRFCADLNSTAKRDFEVCFNEGDTEKGYGAEYEQRLWGKLQPVDYTIYIPSDNKDPGELIVQFSLGNLKLGEKVTISNISLEEISLKGSGNLLAEDFSFKNSTKVWTLEPTMKEISATDVTRPVNWATNANVSSSGDKAGDLNVSGNQATMKVNGGENVWDARLNIDTAELLEAGKTYQVSYSIKSNQNYEEYEALYGSGYKDNGIDNNGAYAERKGLALRANVQETVKYMLTPGATGKLLLSLQLGKTGGRNVTVAVGDVKIEEVVFGTPSGGNLADVTYPSADAPSHPAPATSFVARDGKGTLAGDGSSVTMTCTDNTDAAWQRGLFVNDLCTLTAGCSYKVSFDLEADAEFAYEVCYDKNDHFGSGQEKGYGDKGGLTAGTTKTTVTHTIDSATAGKLLLNVCVGLAPEGTRVTVSNIQVIMTAAPSAGGSGSGSTETDIANVIYPTTAQPSQPAVNSFKARDDVGAITGDGSSVTFTRPDSPDDITDKGAWTRGLFVNDICQLTEGKSYSVSFDIQSTAEFSYEVCYDKDDHFGSGKEKGYGDKGGLTAGTTKATVTHTIDSATAGKLLLNICLGLAAKDTQITVSNIKVIEKSAEGSGDAGGTELPEIPSGNLAQVTYPTISDLPASTVSFRAREDGNYKGTLTGTGSSATMTCTGGPAPNNDTWQRGIFVDDVCRLTKGKSYEVSMDLSADKETSCEVCYNKDDHFGAGKEKGFGAEYDLTVGTQKVTVKHTVTATEDSKLLLLVSLGRAPEGAQVTVSNIQVKEIGYETVSTKAIDGFGSVWEEHDGAYTAALTKNADSAELAVTNAPANTNEKWQGYNTKLFIRTGFVPKANTYYRISFKIKADKAQESFHAIYNGWEIKGYGGEYNIDLDAGVEKTVTHVIPAGKSAGELVLQLELGLIDQTGGNTFLVSDITLEEVTFDIHHSYLNQLSYFMSGPSLKITRTPFAGSGKFTDNDWMVKMFIDTGVKAWKDETYRVSFRARAENEETYIGVCYNRDDVEKDYGSASDIYLGKRKWKTIEHTFTSQEDGILNLQLMLGNVKAPNEIWVDKLRIENITQTKSDENVLPESARYKAPSAVSYWAHEDYTTMFTGTDDAITANITAAPAKGAEPWKIKLFLDTGVTLQPGKYYKVTANVNAKASQDLEVCYNNGGIEMGYDSLGGLRAMGGETLTVEKTISVPVGKRDTNNLMLQFNLGKTTKANAITVSDVKVEEVALSYNSMMPADFAYTTGSTVNSWTAPDYTTALESLGNAATLHITGVPAADPAVWKAKLLVNTGATLSAGKSYLVRADLLASKAQTYELCYNNEETEKGFDVLYGQHIEAGTPTTIQKNITVPASMTDAGELILQFSVGGAETNDFTVSGVSVQELNFGAGSSGTLAPDTVINLYDPAGTLSVTREKLSYQTARVDSGNAIRVSGADLRAGDLCTVSFTAKADRDLTGAFALAWAEDNSAVISQQFALTGEETVYSFTTAAPLSAHGDYDLLWRFAPTGGQSSGGANVEISNISVSFPAETLSITHAQQNVMVNGKLVTADTYNINNGNNYVKLRDLAMLLNDTDAQFAVRYNADSGTISLTTGRPYAPVGGELTVGEDLSASCMRNASDITINGNVVNLKAYTFGGYNFFRLRDLNGPLGFTVDYLPEDNAISIQSPLTPEAQEKGHAYDLFFLPEIDGESQPYVGDTMPYYEDGTYYIYYLKDGGDAYNHSVYLATTKDFVTYTEMDDPVLSASREDVQDAWIGTGSVVKVENTYYFFYTGFNSSGSQEYHEKIMVAKGSSPTSFEKVSTWEITPPKELGQKNDFRDPQAYYDPKTRTISLTVTAGKDGTGRILKYTLGKDLKDVKYDGIIFTDPTGDFWNMECSDTFRLGDKWYLTYSGQDDTLWYAKANSRFGPYSAPTRLEGKLFYAAKHVEDGENSYMVGWARRANSASSTQEVSGWAGNIAVQKLEQRPDGSLLLVPVDGIVSAFEKQEQTALETTQASLTAGADKSYKAVFTSSESFMLKGKFTYTETGSFGLAFDFNGKEEEYKLISVDPQTSKLSLSFGGGKTPITETQAELHPGQEYSFTYIQDGSVGIFYVDGQAALSVRLYGTTDKPIYLFAENNSVTFTSLQQFTR